MGESTWFLAEEALEAGLIDSVEGKTKEKNNFDLSLFDHWPKELQNYEHAEAGENSLTAKNIEKALRDAGFSRREARGVVARGYNGDDLCDADQKMKNEMEDLIQSLEHKS